MHKFMEVLGITGGVLGILILAVVVGGAILWYEMTKDGKNPFQ